MKEESLIYVPERIHVSVLDDSGALATALIGSFVWCRTSIYQGMTDIALDVKTRDKIVNGTLTVHRLQFFDPTDSELLFDDPLFKHEYPLGAFLSLSAEEFDKLIEKQIVKAKSIYKKKHKIEVKEK